MYFFVKFLNEEPFVQLNEGAFFSSIELGVAGPGSPVVGLEGRAALESRGLP